MELETLKDVVQIFAEVKQISTKQSKLIPLIGILTIFINSLIYILNILSTKSLFTDLITKQAFLLITSPTTPEFFDLLVNIKDDIKILFGLEGIYILVNLTTSLLLLIATVLASSLLYGGKHISLLDLVERTIKSFKRPLVTGFYVTLFITGYIFLILGTLLPVVFIVGGPVWFSLSISYIFTILVLIFFTYLDVVWTLAFVLSIVEEKYGMEALGKAAAILKGMKLKGFILNLIFTTFSVVLSLVMIKSINLNQTISAQVSIGLITVVIGSVIRMVQLISFTVLYHKCKKIHGEEVELHGSKGYAKVDSIPLINANIP
ncbi:hypothetical protein ACFE04_008225 [Oxalis oulophora]